MPIHTLASAAHEVLHTLFRRRGNRGLIFDSPAIDDSRRSQFAKALGKAYTFFKHARHDHEDSEVEFNPDINEIILMACAFAIKEMGEIPNIEEVAIGYWFIVHNPHGVPESDTEALPEQLEGLRTKDRREFLQALDDLLARGKIVLAAAKPDASLPVP